MACVKVRGQFLWSWLSLPTFIWVLGIEFQLSGYVVEQQVPLPAEPPYWIPHLIF